MVSILTLPRLRQFPSLVPTTFFPMKNITLALLASTICLSAQKPDAPEAKVPETPQWILDINALSEDDQKEYGEKAGRCKHLFDQKRIFECLAEIRKTEAIYDGNPGIMNLQGACYVEFRNFEKALASFNKALEIQKGDFNVRFNIAEIKFVSQDYKAALTDLETLFAEAENEPKYESMIPLIDFKIILCKLKLKDVEGATAIVDKFDFLSDSPIFYYGKAALEYNADNAVEAERWLARARKIFRNPKILAPWQDTLIEFGYIKSFYGGDLDVESGPAAGVDLEGE